MQNTTVRFNTKDNTEFFKTLRKRVNLHFKENNISKNADLNMKLKTVFMLCLYFVPFILLLTGVASSSLGMLAMWSLIGFGMAGIGLSVMHDANHGSYSTNQKVNKTLSTLLYVLGGYPMNWRIQHNVLHHSFTNVNGHDEDLENGVLRLSPEQEAKKIFKYQKYYASFLYAIMTLYWSTAKDFMAIKRYRDKNLLETQKRTYKTALTQIIISKVLYVGISLVLPLVLIQAPWWEIVLGYVMMHAICGLVLALIFQPAHVIEETSFFSPNESGSIENNWAIHQILTTANFAKKSKIFSWYVGGLNYQIEHHLFPNICHVHYHKISNIVRDTAKEFELPYHEHTTFFNAVRSHYKLLGKLGKVS